MENNRLPFHLNFAVGHYTAFHMIHKFAKQIALRKMAKLPCMAQHAKQLYCGQSTGRALLILASMLVHSDFGLKRQIKIKQQQRHNSDRSAQTLYEWTWEQISARIMGSRQCLLGATLLTTTGEPRYERCVVLSLLLLLIKAENVINAVGVPNTMMMMPRRIVGHQQRR